MKCTICKKTLIGQQRKFCSVKCKNQSTNKKHQNYKCQQERGLERKLKLIESLGGKCEECGYDYNYAALSFHHKEPAKKKFQLDARHCSNRTWEKLAAEAKKCQLLCVNCHFDLHYPQLRKEAVGRRGLEPRT